MGPIYLMTSNLKIFDKTINYKFTLVYLLLSFTFSKLSDMIWLLYEYLDLRIDFFIDSTGLDFALDLNLFSNIE